MLRNRQTPATLTSSAFADEDSGDTHAASQWQVHEAGGDFSSPVFDSGETIANKTTRGVGGLAPDTAYRARVRHKDDAGAWSDWSAASARFTTDAVPEAPEPPAAPVITSPAEGATIAGAFTLAWE